jgi:uncharacterized protein (DUF433 family)
MQIINHIIMKDGEARIAGKEHLKAEMVARMIVDGDSTIDATMEQYGLTAAEVHAAVAYYYDNQAALDAAHAQVLAEINQNATTLDQFKAKLAAQNKINPKN